MKKVKLIIAILLTSSISFAQNEVDFLRYSNWTTGGTARSLSMGGAFGALGADFSNLGTNPAGMGLYKKSDFMFSPTFNFSNVTSDFGNMQGIDRKSNVNFGNIGIVFTGENNPNKWNFLQFGFGVNRVANFNNKINIQAENHTASLISAFQDRAFDKTIDQLDEFSTLLAWNTYLFEDTVRTNEGVLAYSSYLNKGGTKQVKTITQSGAINEMVISFSGSYKDKFYLGGTIGFPMVKFTENSSHIETDELDTIVSFRSFEYTENFTTTGTGFNVKLGMIFRPIDWIRVGLAFHSQTIYNLHDKYNTSMTAVNDLSQTNNAESSLAEYDYQMSTPSKFIGSLAFTIQKLALISADIEYIDFTDGNYSADGIDFSDANNSILKAYTSAVNIKTGAEIKLAPMSLRVGFALNGSPYASGVNDGSSTQYSGGIGFKEDNYYIDFAYIYTQKNEDYYLYGNTTNKMIDPANLTFSTHRIVMTLGAKF